METRTMFKIAFFIILAGMLAIRMYFNLRVRQQGERVMPDRQAIQHEGAGLFVTRVILFIILIAILVLYAIDQPLVKTLDFKLPDWLRWAGFILGWLSLGLTMWTQFELGKQFSPQLQLRAQHQLVTSGPYTHVRHPLYTALNGFGLSLALVSANWLFVAFFILSLVGLAARVPKEEKMMMEQFRDEYQAYMRKTGRYFPKL